MSGRKYGPTRGELVFRACFSVVGLCALAAAVVLRGLPEGPGLIEVVGVAGALFGGTLVLSLWKLLKRDHP